MIQLNQLNHKKKSLSRKKIAKIQGTEDRSKKEGVKNQHYKYLDYSRFFHLHPAFLPSRGKKKNLHFRQNDVDLGAGEGN